MKFLIDAHLPPSLCRIFEVAGHEAIHTSSFGQGNAMPDTEIVAFSMTGNWIVVSKDSDFYFSHILERKPERLLLVRIGNMRLRELVALFEKHFSEIVLAFESNSLVELHVDRVRS